MSVMACDRFGCDTILCARWSPTFGYICSDCFEELVDEGIETDIPAFMSATKGTSPTSADTFAWFDSVFEDFDE